jgi:tripartite-type tricarboxylate transporter receptor subunit TctC
VKIRRRCMLSSLLVCAAALASGCAVAQSYPARPITLVVPFAAGGPTDVVGRTIAIAMGRTLGQTIVIENKLGAGGTIAANYVAKAAPDGYTILIHHNGMATAPALYRRLPFNPLTDFEYIGQLLDVPMTLLARKDLPPDNFAELAAYVQANATTLNLASAGLGAVSHLCGMLFQRALGVELTTVPYPGTAPALTALLGGEVDILCDETTQTLPHIQGGTVKLYGVTTRERVSALPDTPSLSEVGLRDFEVKVWHGLYAPKGTPPAALEKLNEALRAALKDPAVIARMTDLAAEIVPESKQTPEGLRAWLAQEIDKWGPVIRSAAVFGD